MAYVNDPSELALLPELENTDLDLDEPEDYHDKFWEEYQPSGRPVGYQPLIHTQVCRFNPKTGEHTQMAKDCPHFDTEDQEGQRINPSWTVQQSR